MLDVAKMLEELRQERAQLEEAINTLERQEKGRGPRREEATGTVPRRRRGRPPGSKNKKVTAATSVAKDSAA